MAKPRGFYFSGSEVVSSTSKVLMNITIMCCECPEKIWNNIVFNLVMEFKALNFIHIIKFQHRVLFKERTGVSEEFAQRDNTD